MFSLHINKRIHTLVLGCMLAILMPIQLCGADHHDAPIMNTLQECMKHNLINRNLKNLESFAKLLEGQNNFITDCTDLLALHKKFLNKQSEIDKEVLIKKDLDVILNTKNTMPRSNDAIAWALRYHTLETIITPDTLSEQYNEAQTILYRWQNTDNDEIQSLISLYTHKLDMVDWAKVNLLQKSMYRYASLFCDLVAIKKELKSEHGPFIYSCLLARLAGPILKKSCNSGPIHAANETQEEYKTVESIINRYKEEKNKFATLRSQIQQAIAELSGSANKDEWLVHLKQNDKKNKNSAQPTKKKKRSRNKGKGKYIEPKTDTFDEASASSSSSSSDQAPLAYQKRTAMDNSSMILEDDTKVTITDPKNKITLTLWKVAEPQQTYSNPRYTAWVHAWLYDTEQAMENQKYNNPDSAKYHLKNSARIVHSFAHVADQYINQCGIVSNIINNKNKQHIAITMPGYITYPNGIEQYGLFTYFIDTGNGEWYHRNFTEKTREELYTEYMNAGLYEVEFPELK